MANTNSAASCMPEFHETKYIQIRNTGINAKRAMVNFVAVVMCSILPDHAYEIAVTNTGDIHIHETAGMYGRLARKEHPSVNIGRVRISSAEVAIRFRIEALA